MSATADTSATAGTHTIVVSKLATVSSTYADPIAANSTFAAGDMKFTVGGVEKKVTVDGSNNTLSTLSTYINAHSSDLGVTASVLNNADGTQTLALVASTSGTAGETIVTAPPAVVTSGTDENGDPITINTPTVFHVGTQAQDANLTVDGVPRTSSSNTLTNILPGVNVNLAGKSDQSVTLTIAADTSKASQSIQTFVSAYNSLVSSINNQFKADSSNSQGVLAGDSGLRSVQNTMLSSMSLYRDDNTYITNLRSMGVKMENDGTLTVDSAILSSALKDHYTEVKSFFQDSTRGFATNLKTQLTDLTSPTIGVFNVEIKGLQDTNSSLTKSINDFEVRMTAMQQKLLNEYNKINAALQMFPMQQSQIAEQLASLK